MSADNWRVCSRCQKVADDKKAKEKEKLAKSYGKVSVEKFLIMKKEVDKPIALQETLREDFEQGIEDGEYHVSYSASCDQCGFRFTHEDTIEIDI